MNHAVVVPWYRTEQINVWAEASSAIFELSLPGSMADTVVPGGLVNAAGRVLRIVSNSSYRSNTFE